MRPFAAILAVLAFLAVSSVSIFIGVSDLSLDRLLAVDASGQDIQILLASRIPRTLALVLAGAGMAVSGLIMQMLARNRFVEPSTAGTAESAALAS